MGRAVTTCKRNELKLELLHLSPVKYMSVALGLHFMLSELLYLSPVKYMSVILGLHFMLSDFNGA